LECEVVEVPDFIINKERKWERKRTKPRTKFESSLKKVKERVMRVGDSRLQHPEIGAAVFSIPKFRSHARHSPAKRALSTCEVLNKLIVS
jgi:single-stranded DNA-binding protein